MKISECKNAPQWLIDASTHNADVDIDEDGFVTWHGGDWHGGDWHGGDWWGGDWHGGDWHGGDWWGGDWWGGDWHGGDWRGGDWWGGDWHGGDWHGGDWWGESLKTPTVTIYSLKWPIVISNTRMQIGCERHTHQQWRDFDDATINKMDRGALKFWRGHKDALLAMCDVKAKEAE